MRPALYYSRLGGYITTEEGMQTSVQWLPSLLSTRDIMSLYVRPGDISLTMAGLAGMWIEGPLYGTRALFQTTKPR